jgi:serine/threonine protein phosphatase 1
MAAPIYFAIGDIHGEAVKLAALHSAILDRIAFEKASARIIHLGDYVDRGPDSRGVIDGVMRLEDRYRNDARIEVISLMGNHEQMMLNAYDSHLDPGSWWTQGGQEAADSYAGGKGKAGADWRDTIPREHLAWLRTLAPIYRDDARNLVFVHAGIDPATYPDCTEAIRLWTRSQKFFDFSLWPNRPELQDLLVIHGHTPKNFLPEVYPHRINVDTGACFGGPLTAVMLKENTPPEFLRAI